MAKRIIPKVIGMAMTIIAATSIQARELSYFDSTINYWRSKSEQESPQPTKDAEVLTAKDKYKKIQSKSEKNDQRFEFQWQEYLDPKNPEFFREGDYMPPEPFMELVRNPTDANIRMWFSYMEKKNELSTRLAKRMEEFAKNNTVLLPKEAKENIQKIADDFPISTDDFERLRFRMYFDSQCPHCHEMFETLNDLQDRGYFVEARQVDQGSLAGIKSNVAIAQASPQELKKFNVTAVPLLLIGDLKAKKVYRQSGFMTPEQVLSAIRH